MLAHDIMPNAPLAARGKPQAHPVTERQAQLQAAAVAAPFLIVSAAQAESERLAGCLRRLDRGRDVRRTSGDREDLGALAGKSSLVLIDLDAPGCRGVGTVFEVVHHACGRPVVALASATDEANIRAVLLAGAWSYIPRSYTEPQMLDVLQLALDGTGHRPPGPLAKPESPGSNGPNGAPATKSKLTPKQIEVLALAADGLSNKQIAGRLEIAEGTVKLHLSAIYSKLEVRGRPEAIVLARRLEEVRAYQIQQAEFGDQVLNWLLPHVTHRHVEKGETLFRAGDQSQELYYIQRGRVRLEEIGVEMGPGELLGEIGLFSPAHERTCTAVCKTDVELFCLGSEQARSVYYMNPQFALHIVRLIAQRLLADRERLQ